MKAKARYLFTISLLLLLSAGAEVHAQCIEAVNLEGIRPSDGLSSGVVTSIIQDAKGFMWFGTINGLTKYDGYQCTIFRHNSHDSGSISNNYVSALFRDSKNRIWLANGSPSKVELMDPEHNRFVHPAKNRNIGLLKHLVEDIEGNILFADDRGIYRATVKNGRLKINPLIIINADSAFIDDRPRGLYADHKGNLFLCASNRIYRLERIAADRYRVVNTWHFPWWNHQEYGTLVDDTARHRILLQTHDHILSYKDELLINPDTLVHAVIEKNSWSVDAGGNIWYYANEQLYKCTSQQQVIACKASDPAMSKLMAADPAMYWDRDGNLWMGTLGYGVGKYSAHSNFFQLAAPGVSVHHILPDGDHGFLWDKYRFTIGTDGRAVGRPLKQPCYVIATDGPDYCWAMNDKVVVKVRNDGAILQKIPIDTSGLNPNILSFTYLDREGKIWIGFDYSPYLGCFDTVTKTFVKFHFPSQRRFLDYHMVRGITDDPQGIIWCATVEGLFSFDPNTKHWKYYSFALPQAYDDGELMTVCNDPINPDRTLWIGTANRGLLKLDKKTGQTENYNYPDHLPDNIVYGILPDLDGSLWLSSRKGLTKFNPKDYSATTYDKSDGLQDDEFNGEAAARLGDGTLVFGGLFGINYFDPRSIQKRAPPSVVLTSLRIFNKTVAVGDSNKVLSRDISYTSKIVLQHFQNVVSIDFAGLDYSKRNGLYYRHRLQGFEDAWQYTGKGNTATYTNLDPGTYHFIVQCSFSGGAWSDQAALLTISVIPPWWRTWWFYLLIVVTVLSLTYMLYRYRVRQLLKVERMRVRIAQDLHDEIGSTLSTLSIYARVAQQRVKSGDAEAGEALLDKIGRNAAQIMTSLSDIVWSINTRFDDFSSIVSRMREYASSLFEAQGCRIHFSFDETLASLTIPMTKRKDFYLIFKEALNNVSKYASCRNLWITVAQQEGKIALVIRDDGQGFDPGSKTNGNGLHNMRERAAQLGGSLDIISAESKGTILTLRF